MLTFDSGICFGRCIHKIDLKSFTKQFDDNVHDIMNLLFIVILRCLNRRPRPSHFHLLFLI